MSQKNCERFGCNRTRIQYQSQINHTFCRNAKKKKRGINYEIFFAVDVGLKRILNLCCKMRGGMRNY